MPRKPIEPGSMEAAKNIVRGVWGQKNDADVYNAIASAVEQVPKEQLSSFSKWIDLNSVGKLRVFPPAKATKYRDLSVQACASVGNLSRQLNWSCELLAKNLGTVSKYLGLLEAYESAYMRGNYEEAMTLLLEVERSVGLSIWLIEAKIAILHRHKGLEIQKEFANSIHKEHPNSIPAYIAHYTGQRNEDSVAFDKYISRISTDIARQPVNDEIKTFIKSRLIGKHETLIDAESIRSTLAVASVTSVVDAYEGLLDALHASLQRPDITPPRPVLKQVLARLKVNDWRLEKLRGIVTGAYDGLLIRDLRADDALLQGDFDSAVKLALSQTHQDPRDIDALAIVAAGAPHAENEPDLAGLSAPQHDILTLFRTIRAKHSSVEKAASDLSKLVQNFRSIRIMGAVWGYLASEWLERPQIGPSEATAIFYSTATLNPKHWIFLSNSGAKTLLKFCKESKADSLTIETSISQSTGSEISNAKIASPTRAELNTLSSLYQGNLEVALNGARDLASAENNTLRCLAAKIEIHCLLEMDREDEAICRSAAYCCQWDYFRHVLPLRTLLAGKRWKDIRHLCGSIELPIILDVYWRTIDDSEHETNRRSAYDEFLKAHACKRPSELRTIADEFKRDQLVYFLWLVCIPDVMDVAFNVFATSREILEERIQICSLLSELDPENKPQYADEIKEITKYLSIQDGLRDVDRSRVHINTEAVARWAEKQVKESFDRYKDLLRAKVGFGSPDDFDMIVRKAAGGDPRAAEKLIRYPVREGDELLIEMFEAIQIEALTNSDFGLDAYLSMRIRHGSLSGHMRGPLEEMNLIVSKDELGKYQDNKLLAERLQMRAGSEQACLFESIRSFSSKYDSIIEDLTKNYLQIKSKEKPKGMFATGFEINPVALHYVRSHIQEETSFAEFLVLVFTGFELLLNQALLNVRDYITFSVKREVEGAFEVLRLSLERGTSPFFYAKLNSVIADAIPAVQAAIDRVAEWFVPAEKQQGAAVRTVEQIVEIGIATTRAAHRGFSPKIERDIEAIDLRLSLLSELTDVLFTVLENVYRHSGNKVSPWVKLRIWSEPVTPRSQRLKIYVESEVASGSYTEVAAKRLDRIRQQMKSGEYRNHVNLEGGTGLLKLKRIVSLDERQNLEFGFANESSFFVSVELVVPLATSNSLA